MVRQVRESRTHLWREWKSCVPRLQWSTNDGLSSTRFGRTSVRPFGPVGLRQLAGCEPYKAAGSTTDRYNQPLR